MREEVCVAVIFLTRLIEKGDNFTYDQIEHFKLCLLNALSEKFKNHWFPEQPYKGQAYRCIRVNNTSRREPVLEEAALSCGIKYEDLKLPCELTVWIDPNEVCCRFGEHRGSFCVLASFCEVNGIKIQSEGDETLMGDALMSDSMMRSLMSESVMRGAAPDMPRVFTRRYSPQTTTNRGGKRYGNGNGRGRRGSSEYRRSVPQANGQRQSSPPQHYLCTPSNTNSSPNTSHCIGVNTWYNTAMLQQSQQLEQQLWPSSSGTFNYYARTPQQTHTTPHYTF